MLQITVMYLMTLFGISELDINKATQDQIQKAKKVAATQEGGTGLTLEGW